MLFQAVINVIKKIRRQVTEKPDGYLSQVIRVNPSNCFT